MTPDEQAIELHRLEVLAKKRGMSLASFELLLRDLIEKIEHSTIVRPPSYLMSELKRRIQPPRTGNSDPGATSTT